MGVQVWMLGAGRAIPRNFNHTVINDALIDWQKSGANYNDVIIKAAGEAPESHTFVTEFAGASTIMQKQLNADGRFGDLATLAVQPTALAFVDYLSRNAYARQGVFPSPLKAILANYIPVPAGILAKGITADQFYQGYRYYSTDQYYANDRIGWTVDYQPQKMADEIAERVVKPTLAAGALFDAMPYLTRLYTTISPKDMNKDPAFSFNPGLADVSNIHQAQMKIACDPVTQDETSAWLTTEQGWNISYPKGRNLAPTLDVSKMPASLRIEVLREEGAAQVVSDNSPSISDKVGKAAGCGCQSTDAMAMLLGLWPLAGLALRSRRRR
jgi:hypothetical protein